MSIADLIQWGRTAQRTGYLRLEDRRGKEIQIVFRDGRIVFSASNDRRESWGNYIKHLGFVTQDDVEAAFKIKESTGASVASILVRQGMISHDQATATLTQKTIEDLCDVFLWPDGDFKFEPAVPAITSSLVLNLDPIHVVVEGVRRAEVWTRINTIVHATSYYEGTDNPVPTNPPWEDLAMARIVLPRLNKGVTVGEVVESLPFSRYKIYRAVFELLEHDLVRPGDATAAGDRRKRMVRKVEDADRAAAEGRWAEAIEIMQGLTTTHPDQPELGEKLLQITRGFEQATYRHNFTKDDVPVVTIGPDALGGLNIHPADAFLLTRIDGRGTVRDILRLTPLPEIESLRALKRLLAARVIDFPSRRMPEEKAPAKTRG
jgi:hypothetical protein